MPSGTLLLGFVAAALVILLISGAGVLYVVARSAGQGNRAGLVSAARLTAGALVLFSLGLLGFGLSRKRQAAT